MFSACCSAQVSSPRNKVTQKIHRIGNTRQVRKKLKVNSSPKEQVVVSSFVKQFKIPMTNRSNLDAHQKYNLLASFIYPHSTTRSGEKSNDQSMLKLTTHRTNIAALQQESTYQTDIFMKYSTLQQKYINILQKSNKMLQKEMLKSRVLEESIIRSKTQSQNKSSINSQLKQLKNRLNKIDFSNIDKLANLNIKDSSPIYNKQNKDLSTFKLLRKKFQ